MTFTKEVLPLRDADDAIYLNEDRYNNPKEVFKVVGARIQERMGQAQGKSFLDVGCATGELVWHLKSLFPKASFRGADVSENMIRHAQKKMPEANFSVSSATDTEFFEKETYDVITCVSVLSIFDNPGVPIRNFLRALNPGGLLVIHTIVNDFPVDMLMRYRDVTSSVPEWQAGWNVFSKKTLENEVHKVIPRAECRWTEFRMPFDISPVADPMRTWTISTAENPHQLVNGAGQLINMKILEAYVPTQ